MKCKSQPPQHQLVAGSSSPVGPQAPCLQNGNLIPLPCPQHTGPLGRAKLGYANLKAFQGEKDGMSCSGQFFALEGYRLNAATSVCSGKARNPDFAGECFMGVSVLVTDSFFFF